jgi:alcohol dehydrogenase
VGEGPAKYCPPDAFSPLVTTPLLMKTVMSGKIQPRQLITHHFNLDDIMNAYDAFSNAMEEHALKVIISNA